MGSILFCRIFHTFNLSDEIFCIILSVPQTTVMDLNNVIIYSRWKLHQMYKMAFEWPSNDHHLLYEICNHAHSINLQPTKLEKIDEARFKIQDCKLDQTMSQSGDRGMKKIETIQVPSSSQKVTCRDSPLSHASRCHSFTHLLSKKQEDIL